MVSALRLITMRTRIVYLQPMSGQGHVTYFLNFGTRSITFERKKLNSSFFFFVRSTVASTTQRMMNDPKGGVVRVT